MKKGEYEEDLDTYFVDRMRFLNQKDQRAQSIRQHFKQDTRGREGISEGEDEEGGQLSVVCVDGSPASEAALKFALDNLTQSRWLVLAHGIPVSLTTSSSFDDPEGDERHTALERHYLDQCREAGKHCTMKHFTYTTRGGFGHAVCHLADKRDAASVVIGQRHPRPLLGASSTAVMKYCGRRPVLLVPEPE